MSTPTMNDAQVVSWPQYIAMMEALATEALLKIDVAEADLSLGQPLRADGPCPDDLRESAMTAAMRLHDVITAYERRQEAVSLELHRNSRLPSRPQVSGSSFDASA
jgi:hypothetical protein